MSFTFGNKGLSENRTFIIDYLTGCHSAEIGKLLNYLAEGKQMPLFTKALAKNNQNLQNSFDDQSAGAMRSHFQTMKQNQLMVESASQALSQPQTDIKICEVMENITNALPNSHVSPLVH